MLIERLSWGTELLGEKMSYWMLKALFQGGISFLPRNQSWNYLFQKYITKSLDLNATKFENKLMQCKEHMENYLATIPVGKSSFSVLELGTGWLPIIPIGLYICGASKIWTVDKISLLHSSRVREVLTVFIEYAQNGSLVKILPWIHDSRVFKLKSVLEDKSLSSPAQILERLKIYTVVSDARNTGLKPSTIDLFVSNNTLEHIPEDVILSIFFEFKRLGSPYSLMSHHIDMRDHYANFDRSITPYNFLKYSEPMWRLFNNSLQYQNRLRVSDFCRIHETAGFKILHRRDKKGFSGDLDSVRISKEFLRYSREELLVLDSWIVSTCNN